MTFRMLSWLVVLTACQRAAPASVAAHTPVVAEAQGVVQVGQAPPAGEPVAPEAYAALATRLKARDVADLPDREALVALGGAEGLLWLIDHGQPAFVATRAAERLGLLGPEAAQAALIRLAQDDAASAELRAGAVAGLGHLQVDALPEVGDALVQLAVGPDDRLGREAVAALRGAPATWSALRSAASSHPSDAVRARLAVSER